MTGAYQKLRERENGFQASTGQAKRKVAGNCLGPSTVLCYSALHYSALAIFLSRSYDNHITTCIYEHPETQIPETISNPGGRL